MGAGSLRPAPRLPESHVCVHVCACACVYMKCVWHPAWREPWPARPVRIPCVRCPCTRRQTWTHTHMRFGFSLRRARAQRGSGPRGMCAGRVLPAPHACAGVFLITATQGGCPPPCRRQAGTELGISVCPLLSLIMITFRLWHRTCQVHEPNAAPSRVSLGGDQDLLWVGRAVWG